MDLKRPEEGKSPPRVWITARSALQKVMQRFPDEQRSKAVIAQRVSVGLISTRAERYEGFLRVSSQQEQHVARLEEEIPPVFWRHGWDFDGFDWDSGDCIIDDRKIFGLQLCEADIVSLVSDETAGGAEKASGRPTKRGRPPAHWWAAFAEELALYFHKRELPKGGDADGQSAVIEEVFERMQVNHNFEADRTQVQEVVSNVLRRIRSAGN